MNKAERKSLATALGILYRDKPKDSRTNYDSIFFKRMVQLQEHANELGIPFKQLMISLAEPWLRATKGKKRRVGQLRCLGWKWSSARGAK